MGAEGNEALPASPIDWDCDWLKITIGMDVRESNTKVRARFPQLKLRGNNRV
jgi:hypothetical protein